MDAKQQAVRQAILTIIAHKNDVSAVASWGDETLTQALRELDREGWAGNPGWRIAERRDGTGVAVTQAKRMGLDDGRLACVALADILKALRPFFVAHTYSDPDSMEQTAAASSRVVAFLDSVGVGDG